MNSFILIASYLFLIASAGSMTLHEEVYESSVESIRTTKQLCRASSLPFIHGTFYRGSGVLNITFNKGLAHSSTNLPLNEGDQYLMVAHLPYCDYDVDNYRPLKASASAQRNQEPVISLEGSRKFSVTSEENLQIKWGQGGWKWTRDNAVVRVGPSLNNMTEVCRFAPGRYIIELFIGKVSNLERIDTLCQQVQELSTLWADSKKEHRSLLQKHQALVTEVDSMRAQQREMQLQLRALMLERAATRPLDSMSSTAVSSLQPSRRSSQATSRIESGRTTPTP